MATASYLGAPVSIDFDISNRLYIADNLFGSIRVVDPEGIIYTLNEKDNRVFDINQLRVNNHGLTTIYLIHSLKHKMTRLHFQSYAPKSSMAYIEYPYFTLEQKGIYGLEDSIKKAVEDVLQGAVPKEKKSIFAVLSETSQEFSMYLKNHPILFGLLLILLNQGISGVLSGAPLDIPPDFPPL